MSIFQWILFTILALEFGPGLGDDCSGDDASHIQSLLQVDSHLEAEAVATIGEVQVAATRAQEAPLWMLVVGPGVVVGIIAFALLIELPPCDETMKRGGAAQSSFDGPAQRNLCRVQGDALKYFARTPCHSDACGSPPRLVRGTLPDSSRVVLNCSEAAVPLQRPVVSTAVRDFSFQPTNYPSKSEETVKLSSPKPVTLKEGQERELTFNEELKQLTPRLRQSVDAVQMPSSIPGSLAVPLRLNEVLLRLNAEAQGIPCTERTPVIGDMVKAGIGTTTGDARFPEWNNPRGSFFTVSEVDSDGDFKLQDSNGRISGWKYRKEFVFLPEAEMPGGNNAPPPMMNLHDPHAAPLPTPPISSSLQDWHVASFPTPPILSRA